MKTLFLVMLSLILANVVAADVWVESVEFEADQVPLVWTAFPDGGGPPTADARRSDGSFWGRPLRLRPWFRV